MLETGPHEPLLTWALAELPNNCRSVTCEQIPAHRREYLSYEGPISSNRGEVQRWDSGPCQWRKQSAQEYIVSLAGTYLCGLVILRKNTTEKQWICSIEAEPRAGAS